MSNITNFQQAKQQKIDRDNTKLIAQLPPPEVEFKGEVFDDSDPPLLVNDRFDVMPMDSGVVLITSEASIHMDWEEAERFAWQILGWNRGRE